MTPAWSAPSEWRWGVRTNASTASATNPSPQARRAASIRARRSGASAPASTRRRRVAAYAGSRTTSPAAGGLALGHPQRGRGRPVVAEEVGDPGDRVGGAGRDLVALLGVLDGEGEHVRQLPGPVVAQQQQPRVDRARDGRRERAGTGDQVEALGAVVLDGRARRCGALPDEHLRPGILRGGEEAGHVTARPVEVRLDHVQHESAGDGRVEGVAAALEDGLGARAGEPVGRGAHAEAATQRGARRVDGWGDEAGPGHQAVTASWSWGRGRRAARRRTG